MPIPPKDAPTKAGLAAAARAAREAEALRANLKRRKAQAQARKTLKPAKASE